MGQYDVEEGRIKRQQMIAQALRASGNQGFDPAASAGRLVYARSPWEDINKVAQQGVATYIDSKANKAAKSLDAQKTADARTRLGGMLDVLTGKSNMQASADPNASLQGVGPVSVSNPITGQSATADLGPSPQAPVFTNVEKTEQNQKRAALAGMLKGQDPQEAVAALQGPALERALAQPEKLDVGGQFVWRDPITGQVTSRLEKTATKDAQLGADVSIRGQDVGAETQRRAQNISESGNIRDNATSRANAALSAAVSRENARLAADVDREKIVATAAGGKKLADWENKALNLQARMEDAEASLNKDYQPGFWVSMVSQVPGVGNTGYLTSNEFNSYKQAARQWISGVLRLDSGAAVPESEFKTYFETYFPQPGEGEDIVAQKKAAREQVMSTGRSVLGDSANRLPPRPLYQNPLGVASTEKTINGVTYVSDGQGGWLEK